MARKPTDTIQLKVRMLETLRRQMEDAAARNGRSMNAEIVARLGHSIQKDQDAITELAKLLLDSVPDDVRHRMTLCGCLWGCGCVLTLWGVVVLTLSSLPARKS